MYYTMEMLTLDYYHGMDPKSMSVRFIYQGWRVHMDIFLSMFLSRYMLDPPSPVFLDGWTFHNGNWAPYRTNQFIHQLNDSDMLAEIIRELTKTGENTHVTRCASISMS